MNSFLRGLDSFFGGSLQSQAQDRAQRAQAMRMQAAQQANNNSQEARMNTGALADLIQNSRQATVNGTVMDRMAMPSRLPGNSGFTPDVQASRPIDQSRAIKPSYDPQGRTFELMNGEDRTRLAVQQQDALNQLQLGNKRAFDMSTTDNNIRQTTAINEQKQAADRQDYERNAVGLPESLLKYFPDLRGQRKTPQQIKELSASVDDQAKRDNPAPATPHYETDDQGIVTAITMGKNGPIAQSAGRFGKSKAVPQGGGIGAGSVDDTVQVILRNPAEYQNLSAKEKAQVRVPLEKAGFEGFGRAANESALTRIADADSALSVLDTLGEVINNNDAKIGPVAQALRLNPYSDAKVVESQIGLARQRIGRLLEGGVLRKEDEQKYLVLLPNIKDAPKNAKAKLISLKKIMSDDINTFKSVQKSAGRNLNMGNVQPQGGSRPSLSSFEGK